MTDKKRRLRAAITSTVLVALFFAGVFYPSLIMPTILLVLLCIALGMLWVAAYLVSLKLWGDGDLL